MSDRKPTIKILDNSWNAVDKEVFTPGSSITVDPLMDEQYEDALTNDISEVYTTRITRELLYDAYIASPFFEKYGQNPKKIDKNDYYDLYVYFRDYLNNLDEHKLNMVQIFISILEFFELNYDKMYKDIIPIVDKSKILETLYDVYGYKSKLTCLRLF